MQPVQGDTSQHLFRIRLWYAFLVAIVAIFLVFMFVFGVPSARFWNARNVLVLTVLLHVPCMHGSYF